MMRGQPQRAKPAVGSRRPTNVNNNSSAQRSRPGAAVSMKVDEVYAAEKKSMENGDSNILVAVRVRPQSAKERALGHKPIVRVVDNHMIVFDPADEDDGYKSPIPFVGRRARDQRYAFDRVFHEHSTQAEVFEGTTKFLIEGVLNGYNATVFAYGATGAGKTYTMMGSDSSGPGVMVLTVIDLFKMIEERRSEQNYKITISYLEIYNETIRDLLSHEGATSPPLELREDPKNGICVAKLSEHHPTSADALLKLLQRGNSNRTQHGTAVNAESSRSHAVLQVRIEQADRTAGVRANIGMGKLSLIDLAGSERASRTMNRGARLVEGANINKSLLALGNCINALTDPKKKNNYVPYRNSKLTRLLKDSLGGNCRTVMIAAVSPSAMCYEDTLNTLKYANRAKDIKTTATKNIKSVQFHISEYNKIIDDLRAQVSELKCKLEKKEEQAPTHLLAAIEKEAREKEIMEQLRDEIIQAFQDQMRLRRSIMEIEETDRKNALEAITKRNIIQRWEREHPDVPIANTPLLIHTYRKDLAALMDKSKEYSQIKSNITKNLEEKSRVFKEVQESVPRRVESRPVRLFLEQQLRLHEMEVTNLDFERVIQHHKALQDHTMLLLDESQHALSRVQSVLREQFALLKDHGLVNSRVLAEFKIADDLCKEHTETVYDSPRKARNADETTQFIMDALRTPYGLSSRQTHRRVSSGEFRTNSLFQISIPNSPETPSRKQGPTDMQIDTPPLGFARSIMNQLAEAQKTDDDSTTSSEYSSNESPSHSSNSDDSMISSPVVPIKRCLLSEIMQEKKVDASAISSSAQSLPATQNNTEQRPVSASAAEGTTRHPVRELDKRRRQRKHAKMHTTEKEEWNGQVKFAQLAASHMADNEADADDEEDQGNNGHSSKMSKKVKFANSSSSSSNTSSSTTRSRRDATTVTPSLANNEALFVSSLRSNSIAALNNSLNSRPSSAPTAPPTIAVNLHSSQGAKQLKSALKTSSTTNGALADRSNLNKENAISVALQDINTKASSLNKQPTRIIANPHGVTAAATNGSSTQVPSTTTAAAPRAPRWFRA